MDFNEYFTMLMNWKKMPSYKLENRIDSLIGYYLEGILKEFTGEKIVGIIPEFPLHIGTIFSDKESNRSNKVDFLAISESDCHYLVEFKSDSKSIKEEQNEYLIAAKKINLASLIEGVKKICKASSPGYKNKYRYLRNKLEDLEIIDKDKNFNNKKCKDLEIIYIVPSKSGIDRIKINADRIIDFEDIVKYLTKINMPDSFEKEFAKALTEWTKD